MSESTTIVLTCDAASAEDLRRTLEAAGAEVQSTPRRELDGSAATSWLTVATVAISAAPHLVDFLREFLARNRIDSIKVGDLEITGVRVEDLPAVTAAVHDLARDV